MMRLLDPLQFAFQGLLALGLSFLDNPQQFGLLLQPGRVVALERQAAAVLQLQNPLGDVVQEVPVVGDDNHRAGILAQRLLQPLDRFGVEMVGRLVQQQQVGLLQQRHAERHAPPLAAGKLAHGRVVGRQHQRIAGDVQHPVQLPAAAGVDLLLEPPHLVHELVQIVVGLRIGHAAGDLVEAVDQILDRLHGRQQVLADRLVEVQLRLLGHIADAHPLGQIGRAVEVLVDARHDPQQSRFAGPVFADHADLGAVEERQIDIAQHDLLAKALADVSHLEDELWGHGQKPFWSGDVSRKRIVLLIRWVSGPCANSGPSSGRR